MCGSWFLFHIHGRTSLRFIVCSFYFHVPTGHPLRHHGGTTEADHVRVRNSLQGQLQYAIVSVLHCMCEDTCIDY